ENMLACFRRADGVFAMHIVRQADVNEVHIFVVAEAVEGVIGVDTGLGDSILFSVLLPFGVRMPCHQTSESRTRGLIRTGPHEDVADSSQPDGREPQRPFRRGNSLCEGWERAPGHGQGREFGKVAAIHGRYSILATPEMSRAHFAMVCCNPMKIFKITYSVSDAPLTRDD